MSLWDSVNAKWGDGVPHKLGELELSLPAGLVKFQLRYAKTEYFDQAVQIVFSDTKETGSIMGKVAEEKWLTATDPYFLLSLQYERFYFSRDRESMKSYMGAMKSYEVQLENIKDKFEKDQASARSNLEKAEKDRVALLDVLDKHDAKWDVSGRWDDIKVGLHWEKIYAEDEKIKVANATLRKTSPPKIDRSYILAVRTAGLTHLGLSDIVNTVNAKKGELMGTLGVLPKTVTEVPMGDIMSLMVTWNDA
ncbi:MAG: hypothetical protein E3J46_06315 [Desulfobacteraceae bacterium]|nr:MAG: hypothetical protein E3J46_06315 [Desulfobacteraceae bacterium]